MPRQKKIAPPDALEPFRAQLRADGFLINPWRLGVAAGRAFAFRPREVPPSPYSEAISTRRYDDGVRTGIRQAREEARKGETA